MVTSVAYIGNFEPPHSTENHVAQALERGLGIHVRRCQEQDDVFSWSPHWMFDPSPDLVLWTRTAGLSAQVPLEQRLTMLEHCRKRSIPVVGYHLDRWWGLDRQYEIHDDPFFVVDLLITADGGNDEMWAKAGVRHRWMPPAVSAFELEPGIPDDAYRSEVAFVGSWQPGYHPEWTHRPQMVEYLRSWYGERVRFWPQPGQEAVRGQALRDLYASTVVNVGDSCLVGGTGRYWSDRIPETLGRGGLLLHPDVDGLEEQFGTDGANGLWTWPLGDWDALHARIEEIRCYSVPLQQQLRRRAREHVVQNHTYTVRMQQVLQAVSEL